MPLNNFRLNVSHSSPSHYAAQKFNQLQGDLVSTARMWAADEVGAEMAHQLSEPLTALLLYLHEIKERGQNFADDEEVEPNLVREIVEKALRETERVCDIMERIGHTIETPMRAEARDHRAIETTLGNNPTASNCASSAPHHSGQYSLTPRECEVLAVIMGGGSNKEGGYQLGISTRTFEVHRAHIMKKYSARNAADLVRIALREIR
jgi:DNA-binding CsgD family transcriptional regulator